MITAIFTLGVSCYYYFVKFESNITGFYHIHEVENSSPYLDKVNIRLHKDFGYDGNLFLTIALDPLLQNEKSVEALDNPKYRYRRIMYPALAYVISLGNKDVIPYMMVFLNMLAILGITWLSLLYLSGQTEKYWRSLLVLLIPATWSVLGLSTAELITAFFLILAFLSYSKRKIPLLTLAFATALLTRETSLLAWVSLFIFSLRKQEIKVLAGLLISTFPFILWNLYVFFRFKGYGDFGTQNFSLPFIGIYESLEWVIDSFPSKNFLGNIYAFGLMFLCFGLCIKHTWFRHKLDSPFSILVALLVLMFIVGDFRMLHHYLHYTRTFMDIFIVLLLIGSKHFIEKVFWLGGGIAGLFYIYFL